MTYLIILLIILFILFKLYYYYFEYYSQIVNKSKITDYTRWILCDKYVAKKYAELNGFKVAKTYQFVKYPHQFVFDKKNFVVKPVDLCDSSGVYLIKDGINIKTGQSIENISKELTMLRAKIRNEHYMHTHMYNGAIPYNGYIMEELLLDKNGEIPCDLNVMFLEVSFII